MRNRISNIASLALAVTAWAGGVGTVSRAEGAPKIEFDRMVYDFGKTSVVETVSGVFKVKNAGGSTLKIEDPKPSCGCTVAGMKPDKLEPGETGELSFSLNLGHYRTALEKQISVRSNDPLKPEAVLVIKAAYTPLYDAAPMALIAELPVGLAATNLTATITRTDGKPLGKLRFQTSQPWITAKLPSPGSQESSTSKVQVELRREGMPRKFNEFVHVYSNDRTNGPVTSIYLYGQIMGELAVTPEALYWSVPDIIQVGADRSEPAGTRRVTIRAVDGRAFRLQNPTSTFSGVKIELRPHSSGKEYDLIARLAEPPNRTLSGTVSLETSIESQPRIELPLVINVTRPQP